MSESAKQEDILESTTDAAEWSLEVERVLPQLKVTVRTDNKVWKREHNFVQIGVYKSTTGSRVLPIIQMIEGQTVGFSFRCFCLSRDLTLLLISK